MKHPLIHDFISYLTSQGVSSSDLSFKEKEDLSEIGFNQIAEDNCSYPVSMTFSGDGLVRITISKAVHPHANTNLLQQVNQLNMMYCGVNFYCWDNVVTCKGLYPATHLGEILLCLKDILKIVLEEFPQFKATPSLKEKEQN